MTRVGKWGGKGEMMFWKLPPSACIWERIYGNEETKYQTEHRVVYLTSRYKLKKYYIHELQN